MLTVAIPKRNKLQNIIVLTPKDGPVCHKSRQPEIIPHYILVSIAQKPEKWKTKFYIKTKIFYLQSLIFLL